jgi:predicted ATP-dependent endonuclease of OLD family
MLFSKLTIRKLGPFYEPLTLNFDTNVTILTGANDVGKSASLRFVRLFLEDGAAEEGDVNQDHLQEGRAIWSEDSSLVLDGEFRIDSHADIIGNSQYNITPGDTAVFNLHVAKDRKKKEQYLHSKKHGLLGTEIKLPKVVFAPTTQKIRDTLDLTQLNPLEESILDFAFGAEFNFSIYKTMSPLSYSRAIKAAEDNLNNHMRRVLPSASALRFSLYETGGHRNQLSILLRDRHDGITPFGNRGTGVQKMISLLAELLTKRTNNHRIILLDEPENSLHADAQHLLREMLFNLTEDGKTQVIYATHSPCMINPMRPEQIRLLRREKTKDGKATTVLENNSSDKNFFGLRSSLGVSASDSLLFAPVTVIIEGKTEFACIAHLIEKLAKAGTPGFEKAKKLISLAHFLDGEGDGYEYLCRLAKSHGTKVILFLDGDKRHRVEQSQISQRHPDVKIILLPGREEFEQLVPEEVYFQALGVVTQKFQNFTTALEEWKKWVDRDVVNQRKAFSKQVSEWIEESFEDVQVCKPVIMRKAIELAKPEEIKAEPLQRMLADIEALLSDTSF